VLSSSGVKAMAVLTLTVSMSDHSGSLWPFGG